MWMNRVQMERVGRMRVRVRVSETEGREGEREGG